MTTSLAVKAELETTKFQREKCSLCEESEVEECMLDFFRLQETASSNVIMVRISLTVEFMAGAVMNPLFFQQVC